MDYLTFHNREQLKQAYQYKPGNYKCIICSYQYHPQYIKSQNAFLLLDCNHLIHRQCLKSRRHSYEQYKSTCELCSKVHQYRMSAVSVAARKRERTIQYGDEYQAIVKAVEKKGKYSFK